MIRDATDNLVAFGLGVVVGGASALLLAPATGEETRKRLSEEAKRLKEHASKLAQDTSARVQQEVEHLKEVAEVQKAAFREAIHEGKLAYDREIQKHKAPTES